MTRRHDVEVYTRQLDETSALRNFLYRVASEWEWEREKEERENWEEQQKKQKKKKQKKRGVPTPAYAAGELKALGFTFGEPPPEEAVLDGPSWAEISSAPQTPPEEAVWDEQYKLPHRWCVDGVKATVDIARVIAVHCEAEDPETMESLLRSRHGAPHRIGDSQWWLTRSGLGVVATLHVSTQRRGLLVVWFPAKTKAECRTATKRLGDILEMRIGALQRLVDAAIHQRENAEGEDF